MCQLKSPTRTGLVSSGESRKHRGFAFLVSGRRIRLRGAHRFRCDFDRHSACSEDPRTCCMKPQTEVCIQDNYLGGRTGFDSSLEAQTARRGWFVGLVKNRTKQINADNEGLALAA